jgi:hypothetical protein
VTDFIQGLLADFNTATVAGGNAAQISINAAAGLPLGLSLAAQAIINDPSATPDVLNYLINSFLNPGIPTSLFSEFGEQVIGPLLTLLPPQLRVVVGGALADLGTALAKGLAHLPGNFVAGATAVGEAAADLPSGLLNSGLDIRTLGTAIGQALGGGYSLPIPGSLPTNGLAGWLGLSPTVLLATLEAAVDDPGNIPGLASYLLYSLVASPSAAFPPPNVVVGYPFFNYSLFVTTAAPVIAALEQVLPGPLADALGAISTELSAIIGKGLGLLPAPVNPFFALASSSAFGVSEARMMTSGIAFDPFPDADIGDVFGAVQRAAEGLLASAEQLPAGLQIIVKTIAARPELAPALLVGAVNAQIDGLERALAPVFRALIGTLPRDLRLPVGQALGEVQGGLEDIQDHVQDAVTPGDAMKKQSEPQNLSVAGDNKGTSDGPAVTQKDHKNFVNLDISALNPLHQDRKSDDSLTQVGDNGSAVSRPASHELGIGKTPVRDLIKRITGGLDHDTDKDDAGDTTQAAS